MATGCGHPPPEIWGLGMGGSPRLPDPTMRTIRNQVNLSFQAGGYSCSQITSPVRTSSYIHVCRISLERLAWQTKL